MNVDHKAFNIAEYFRLLNSRGILSKTPTKNNNKMINSTLTKLFFTFAIIYLISQLFLPYPFDFAVKIMPLFILMWICISHLSGKLRYCIGGALVFSAIGDVFLSLTIANAFTFGLGAFLIAQLIYTVSFSLYRQPYHDIKPRLIAAVSVAIFSGAMAIYILPSTNELMGPVTVYLIVISCMGISALLSGMNKLTLFGACCFISSDALLAQSIFKSPLPLSNHLVMLTYYLAQFFILAGLVKQQHRN